MSNVSTVVEKSDSVYIYDNRIKPRLVFVSVNENIEFIASDIPSWFASIKHEICA